MDINQQKNTAIHPGVKTPGSSRGGFINFFRSNPKINNSIGCSIFLF